MLGVQLRLTARRRTTASSFCTASRPTSWPEIEQLAEAAKPYAELKPQTRRRLFLDHLFLFVIAAVIAVVDYQRQGELAVLAGVALLGAVLWILVSFLINWIWPRFLLTAAGVRWEAIMLPVLTGGFHNCRAKRRATRKMHAACNNDRTTKPSRS